MNKRVAEVLLGLKEALDENGPEVEGLKRIVAVTHAVNEGPCFVRVTVTHSFPCVRLFADRGSADSLPWGD